MTRTFDDWYRREDYGDREQLERCWASGQNAQAFIDMRGRSDLARKVLEVVEAEEESRFGKGAHGVSSALRELFAKEGIDVTE